jgi:3-hydroxyisobutyrate dehydrogenase-like beta-hydroxyacid dehydrogenase
MKSIAIVGTGIMGSGMGANFLKKGHQVLVWNRSPDKAKSLVELGAVLVASPHEAATRAEIVFEVTANDESSKSVWLGEKGILAGSQVNTVLISSATLSVKWADELIQECSKQQRTFFDIPLTGGRVGAETGALTLLVGGDKEKLETIKPDLASISQKLFYFGPAGSGMRYKLVLNTLQAIHIAGFGEAMKMAKAAGLDLKPVGEALCDRPGGAITNIAWRDYQVEPNPINFSVEWIAKDLEYAKQMASSQELPLLADVLNEYQTAKAEGFGQKDWTVIAKEFEHRLNYSSDSKPS